MIGEINSTLPKPLLPEVFGNIHDEYWKCLNAVIDPRNASQVVYPLSEILHRVICGFLSSNRSISILFPKVHLPESKLSGAKFPLGFLLTRGTVYQLLRKIDWQQANVALGPLWKCMGYAPNLIAGRVSRDPKTIITEFLEEREQEDPSQRMTEKQKSSQSSLKGEIITVSKVNSNKELPPLKK